MQLYTSDARLVMASLLINQGDTTAAHDIVRSLQEALDTTSYELRWSWLEELHLRCRATL